MTAMAERLNLEGKHTSEAVRFSEILPMISKYIRFELDEGRF